MWERPANSAQLTSRLKLSDKEAKVLTSESLAFARSKYSAFEEDF